MINQSTYEDYCLEVHLEGAMCPLQTNDAIFQINHEYAYLQEEQHAKIISYVDCVADQDTLKASINKLSKHISTERCAAIAIVVPEELANACDAIDYLSNDPHNGVRVFFDIDIAHTWVSMQKKAYRKRSLH